MDLVTITCLRDFYEIKLQAESIQKFVEPCTHWIIVNEPNDISSQESFQTFWKDNLYPYYENHKLNILFPNFDIEDIKIGWDIQQYYKLAISEYIKGDYLVLDSKNFFIKPCNTNEWKNILGCGLVRKTKKEYKGYEYQKMLAEYFNVDVSPVRLEAITPFVFCYEDVKKLYPIKKMFTDIYKQSEKIFKDPNRFHISEMQVYSTLIYKYRKNDLLKLIDENKTMFRIFKKGLLLPFNPACKKTFNELIEFYDPAYDFYDVHFTDTTMKNVKCFAIHRMYAEQAPYPNIMQARNWIKSLGLNTLFFPFRSY